MEKNKKRVLWITRTAVFIALLVVVQAATAPLGVTLITGSLVNMVLVVSYLVCGLPSAAVVAVVSPVIAKFVGIGPLWVLVPFIALGNLALVAVWHLICAKAFGGKTAGYFVALVSAAAVKFFFLYLTIVRMMVPLFLNLPAKQAAAVSAAFSVSQLFTALIGGALATAALPVLKKATASGGR